MLRLPPAPLWLRAAAALIRHLPRGRFVAARWARSWSSGPFIARMPARLGGYPCVCDLTRGHAADVWLSGVYEPQETALVNELLKPGMTFVDVGANWGYFTLLGATRVTATGRVVSLEPDPRVFPVLQANVELNQLTQVTVLAVAAADRAGGVFLDGLGEPGANYGLSRLASGRPASATGFRVTARPLDELLDELGVGSIHLLKMDIEGEEAKALAGLSRSLSGGRVQRIILELHPQYLAETGSSAAEPMGRLRAAGFEGWTIDHSPVANRRAHYARTLDAPRWIRPLNPSEPLDSWPHQLWVRRGLPPL